MKPGLVLACVTALVCLPSHGQTNACSPAVSPFFLPPLQLREEARTETAKPEEPAPVQPGAPAQLPVTTVDLVFGDNDIHGRALRSGQFYLTRPEARSDDILVRAIDGIFTPEVVYVGKIPISCSIITAIKRKNPLCLINPLFFQASW
jgi:hypothetical protein